MTIVLDLPGRLAAELPDEPRWLETRAMLRSGHATVFGGTTIEAGFAVRMLHGAFSVAAVVGCPPATAIAAVVEGTTGMTPLLEQIDNADVPRCGLPSVWASARSARWSRSRAGRGRS